MKEIDVPHNRPSARLDGAARARALQTMTTTELDVLVVGGGVTGAGIALDSATRGLSTGIVEASDWATGTSSRSSRLVHGGLRYLYNLDFRLVAESLKERGLLLERIAPHLVTAQPFLWPLKMRVVERSYSAVGVGMYDAIAFARHRRKTVPFQKHLTRKGARELFPDIREDALIGAIRFFDARVDDARLVLGLVRTAARYGAHCASHAKVTHFERDGNGAVVGAVVEDRLTGETHTIRAKHVIAATGVWTEEVQEMADAEGGLRVLASKGIHVVVPRGRIRGGAGLFLRTEKSVLFIIPWPDYWVIGTTDTAYRESLDRPVATAADIDYVLEHANAVLGSQLTREDVIATYAGLRPLLQPGTLDPSKTAKFSREHTVAEAAPGLTTIAGGKLTTYRVMAKDAVDFALGKRAKTLPSVTHVTPLVGAEGLAALTRLAPRIAERYGWDTARVESLIHRYGAGIEEVLEIVDGDPSMGRPLASSPLYLRAEVAHAVSHEGAMGLTDILAHRVRLLIESADRGVDALDEVAEIAAPLLGWDAEQVAAAAQDYRQMVAGILRAEEAGTDEAAAAALAPAPTN
ncbi:MAG TPA: glycerol-3-phosphate dehydrogenase/oxidase [Actinomycetales bacterium]|nr:glycerol-3-phosphate dehydrogenase/oxidase [Actinomycetales bacterium]